MKVSLYGLFPPNIGGVSVHVKRLAERMNIDGYLNKVYINNRYFEEKCEYPSYCLDLSSTNFFEFIRKVILNRKLVDIDRADVFHIHGSLFWDFILVFVIARVYGRKVLFTVHDQMQLNKGAFSNFVYKFIYSFLPKSKIFFIAVNKTIKKQLLSIGIKAEFISVIPAFVKEVNNEPLDIDLLNLARKSTSLFLYAPALRSVEDFQLYGITFTLSAYSQLIDKFETNVKLLLCVPNGIDMSIFNSQIKGLSLDPASYVLITHPINNIKRMLQVVDVYIRPTISDGDSVLLREALSENCPVLASDVVNRPSEAYLYKLFDINDFCEKLKFLIANSIDLREQSVIDHDFYQEIILLYGKLVKTI